jgi:lysozyme
MNLQFIEEREDCKLKAYLDIGGVPTIGFGSLFIYDFFVDAFTYSQKRRVRLTDEITLPHAKYLLWEEASGVRKKVLALTSPVLDDNQETALVSFCYNLGVQAFRGSTLRVCINTLPKDDKFIKNEWLRWNKYHKDGKLVPSKGLLNRRKLEYALWIK